MNSIPKDDIILFLCMHKIEILFWFQIHCAAICVQQYSVSDTYMKMALPLITGKNSIQYIN